MSVTVTEPSAGGGLSDEKDCDALYVLAQKVLDSVVGVYEQAGVPLPSRRYVHFGEVANDCEQLTVQLDQHYFGVLNGDANALQRCDGPRAAVMSVVMFRHEPAVGQKGTPPPVDKLNAAARVHMRDAYLLMTAAGQADLNGGWGTGFIAEVSPIAASGGFTGIAMALSMQV